MKSPYQADHPDFCTCGTPLGNGNELCSECEITCEYYGLELPDEHELDCLNCELVEICFEVYEELLEVEDA